MAKSVDLELKVNAIVEICRLLLQYGAETSRIEKSAETLFSRFDIINPNSFVIPQYMTISYTNSYGENITKAIRCNNKGTDLTKLEDVNQLIDDIKMNDMKVHDIYMRIEKIKDYSSRKLIKELLAYTGISITHTILFGKASFATLVCAAVCSIVVLLFDKITKKTNISDIIQKLFSATILSIFAYACVKTCDFYHLSSNSSEMLGQIIKGNIMLLVPGIRFTNGIKDIFTNDMLSGIINIAHAVFLTLSMTAGIFSFLYIAKNFFK